MDWYPLYNSLRIAAISTVAVFFLGILAAYYIAKLPRLVKGVLDVVLTLPLVLPPTVVGWLLLVLLGPNRPIGAWVQAHFGLRLVMTWWSAVFATVFTAACVIAIKKARSMLITTRSGSRLAAYVMLNAITAFQHR